MGEAIKINVEIISRILQVSKSSEIIKVVLNSGDIVSGSVVMFNGSSIKLDSEPNRIINVEDIVEIQDALLIEWEKYLGKRVNIMTQNHSYDGVVIAFEEQSISVVTESGVENIDIKTVEIISEVVNDSEMEIAKESDATLEEVPITQEEYENGDNIDTDINPSIENIDNKKGLASCDDAIVEDNNPNEFEKAVIDGKFDVASKMAKDIGLLTGMGYSEKEIERIQKGMSSCGKTWKTDNYSVATRLLTLMSYHKGLSTGYFFRVIKSSQKGSSEYLKSLNAIATNLSTKSDEEYSGFFLEYKDILKDNAVFCRRYAFCLISSTGNKINAFENALILGNKDEVIRYANNEELLIELGYEESDIDRIKKGCKNANWDNSMYKSATRVFLMQANLHCIAEALYETALLISAKKSDEYVKILNALATIKSMSDPEEYIKFFNTYRSRLEKNANYCLQYGNSLVAIGDWKRLAKDMQMIESHTTDMPDAYKKIKDAFDYYSKTADFKIEDIDLLYERLKSLDENVDDQAKEINYIKRLPEKTAVISLLNWYSYIEEHDILGELFISFKDILKEDKSQMNLLYKALMKCNEDSIVKLLPEFPVFWCDESIVKRFLAAHEKIEKIEYTDAEERLIKASQILSEYTVPNEFEQAIINDDFDKITKYIDDPTELIALGYSADEIKDIALMDMDEYQLAADKTYILRKILGFQGNKNHFAERYMFEAYFENKIDMCSRLFPLLLEEKRGTLILALFEYDKSLFSNLSSANRMYYLALCYAGADDIFWKELNKNWVKYPEKDIITRLSKLSQEKGDTILLKQLELQTNSSQGNEFENAVISADIDGIRKYVKNANLLVELGYTPEEINKISKIFNSNTTNVGTKDLQKAQRIYLYQKNKNKLAEQMFWGVLASSSQEDSLAASKILFDICFSQKNYSSVIDLYEKYLTSEMTTKFNSHYAEGYAISLFEVERYKETYDYCIRYKSAWDSFNLYIYLIYAAEKVGITIDDVEIIDNLFSYRYRSNIVAQYICHVIDKERMTELVPRLFNYYCYSFAESDLNQIKATICNANYSSTQSPLFAGLDILKSNDVSLSLLNTWVDFIKNTLSSTEVLKSFMKIGEVCDNMSDAFLECAYNLCETETPSSDDLREWKNIVNYIISCDKNETRINRLITILEDALSLGVEDIDILRNVIILHSYQNSLVDLYEILVKYFERVIADELVTRDSLNTVIEYYSQTKEYLDTERKKILALIVNKMIKSVPISKDDFAQLYDLFSENSIEPTSIIMSLIISNDDDYFEVFERIENRYPHFDALLKIIDSCDSTDIKDELIVWKDYFSISEEDYLLLGRLENTINDSGLWIKDDINILAKAILSDPNNSTYWNLLRNWATTAENVNKDIVEKLIENMDFSSNRDIENTVTMAIDRKFYSVAAKLISKLLKTRNQDYIIAAQKSLRQMASDGQCKSELAPWSRDFIADIKNSLSFSNSEDYQWNSVCAALDIAKATGELEFFVDEFENSLMRECCKQNVIVFAEAINNNNTSLAERALNCINSSIISIPYSQLVNSIFESYKNSSLTECEYITLDLITRDYGNLLSMDDYFEFYCEMATSGKRAEGIAVIKYLQKYMQDDAALFEIEASFINNPTNIDEYEQLYLALFNYLDRAQNENPILYSVGRMICGENYLRLKNVEVPSFTKMIQLRYPTYSEQCKKYQELCDSILMGLRSTPYSDYLYAILGSIFKCDWRDMFEFDIDNTVAINILKSLSNSRVNVVDDYHRSFIKSAMLYFLNESKKTISSKKEIISTMWSQLKNAAFDIDVFITLIKDINLEYCSELNAIWSIDIETITIFKKHWCREILSSPNCDKYASVFSVFTNVRGNDFFSATPVRKVLSGMDNERAIEIAKAYEALFVQPAGFYDLIQTNKKVFRDANYETNVFSTFLKKKLPDYYGYEIRAERFKEKYVLIKKIYGIGSFREIYTPFVDLETRRRISTLFSLQHYFRTLAHGLSNSNESTDNALFINTISVALSNDSYMVHLDEFVSHFDSEHSLVTGIIICLCKEKYNKVFEYFNDVKDEFLKQKLASKIFTECGKSMGKKEIAQECFSIAAQSKNKNSYKNSYWIKSFVYAQSLDKLDESIYLNPGKNEAELEDNVEIAEEIVSNNVEAVAEALDEKTVEKIRVTLERDEIEDSDEIALSDLNYIKEFLKAENIDKSFEDYRKKLLKIKDDINNGLDMQDEYDVLAIEIGVRLLKNQGKDFDVYMMSEVMSLIKPFGIEDTLIIISLHDLFQDYLKRFASLEDLCTNYATAREAISHLRYEQFDTANPVKGRSDTRTVQDIKALSKVLDVLDDIATDMMSSMDDDSLKERLIEYQVICIRNQDVRFKQVLRHISNLLQIRINTLNQIPNIVINHNGRNEKKLLNCNWSEEWSAGISSSFVRAIVFNCGGASALDVVLEVAINGQTRQTLEIKKISANEKIPFAVKFTKEDIHDDKVTWKASCYFKDENGRKFDVYVVGEISISITENSWNALQVGRDAFNTQTAAEGEEFCGRQSEMMTLNSMYNELANPSTYPSLLVTGLRRAGKSSVIKHFGNELKRRDNLVPIYVDGQSSGGNAAKAFIVNVTFEVFKHYRNIVVGDFKQFKDKWDAVAAKEDWIEELPYFFYELSELLGGKKVVFIFDEMESVFYSGYFSNAKQEERFFGIIRSLIQNSQEYISFVFCGSDKLLTSCLEQKRESQLFQALQRIYVGRMSINDIRAIFERYNSQYNIKFGDEAIETIMKYTNGLVWYTKVIAYHVLDKIIDNDKIIRNEIHSSDVEQVVDMLISGDLGSELIDLLDNNFGTRRKAIIRAMASVAKDYNTSVSLEKIANELSLINYVDNDTGETLGSLSDSEILENLLILEKMDFVKKDAQREKSFIFTTELYRILMLNDRKIHKFIIRK